MNNNIWDENIKSPKVIDDALLKKWKMNKKFRNEIIRFGKTERPVVTRFPPEPR